MMNPFICMLSLSQYYIIVYIGHSGKRRTRVYDGDIDPYSSTVFVGVAFALEFSRTPSLLL